MKITGIIWLENIVEKLIWKHNVQEQEIIEVLNNKPFFRFVEKGHRQGENVYSAMGQSDAGRYLIVFFIYKTDQKALIVSARDMKKGERRYYEKEK